MLRSLAAVLIGSALLGCSGQVAVVVPPDHPANAAAREAPLPPASDALGPSVSAPRLGASVPGYVCIMHPEVTSWKPGECPKCGMDLVQRSEVPPEKRGVLP